MADTEKAFLWITDLLDKHEVPYQLTGGFAARIYGVNRPLADIDIDLPFAKAGNFFAEIRSWLPSEPVHLLNENWDLVYYTIHYEEQEIDLCDTVRTCIRSGANEDWHPYHTDFSRSDWRKIYGKEAPLVPKEQLIAYKKILNRDVDRADIAQLSNS